MTDLPSPDYLCIGSIFIDDIVFPNGETKMEILGGGGTHSGTGMRVWGERPGLCALAGAGLPESAARRIAEYFDTRGVIYTDLPQARAWQIFEWDGHRTEVFRMKIMGPFIHDPQPEALPQCFESAKAATILRDASNFMRWRARLPNATLLWEPDQPYMVAENREEFRQTAPHAQIVSPNLIEAQQLYGLQEPRDLVRAILDDGAPVAVLRMGEAGSLVGQRAGQTETLLRVPVVEVPQLVDVTGAGNTYCGAFLIGWMRTRDLRMAAAYGSVAASFVVETIGVMHYTRDMDAERDRRLEWVLPRIEQL